MPHFLAKFATPRLAGALHSHWRTNRGPAQGLGGLVRREHGIVVPVHRELTDGRVPASPLAHTRSNNGRFTLPLRSVLPANGALPIGVTQIDVVV